MENHLLSNENFQIQDKEQFSSRILSIGFFDMTPFLNSNQKTTILKIDYNSFNKENHSNNQILKQVPQLSIIKEEKEEPLDKSLGSQKNSNSLFPIVENCFTSKENILSSLENLSSRNDQKEDLMLKYKQHLMSSKHKKQDQDKKILEQENQFIKKKNTSIDLKLINILKKSFLENKDSIDDKKYLQLEKQLQESYSLKKICINLDDSDNHEIEPNKTNVYQTTLRLLKKGEEYQRKRIIKQKEKQDKEISQCSFTPKIKQYKQSQPKNFSQIKQNTFYYENHSKKSLTPINSSQNFIQKNKRDISKYIKKRKEEQNQTFTPKLNKRSLIIAENLSKSPTPKSKKSFTDDTSVQSFKVNPQSEEILTNKLLEEIYLLLIDMGIKNENNLEMGDITLSPDNFYKFMQKMNFIPNDMPKLKKQLLFNHQFLMEKFDKKYQQFELLLQELWNYLSFNGQNQVEIQKLTLFVLSLYNLKTEMAKSLDFNQRKISKKYLLFKQQRQISKKQSKINKTINTSKDQNQQLNKSINNEKQKKMVNNHRKKILKKYASFIEQGLLKPPQKNNLSHKDYLVIEKQVKQLEHKLKAEEKQKLKYKECTFKPTINQNFSSSNLSNLSSQYRSRLSKKTSKALKLNVVIKDDDRELFLLQSKNDIYREVARVKEKYNLNDKKCQKLTKVLKNQWDAFDCQNNQQNNLYFSSYLFIKSD